MMRGYSEAVDDDDDVVVVVVVVDHHRHRRCRYLLFIYRYGITPYLAILWCLGNSINLYWIIIKIPVS